MSDVADGTKRKPGNSRMRRARAQTCANITGHSCRHKKNDRVSEQECEAENEQRADAQEKHFVCQLTNNGADVMCPERAGREQTRDGTGDGEGENIELAISVPRFSVTDQPR